MSRPLFSRTRIIASIANARCALSEAATCAKCGTYIGSHKLAYFCPACNNPSLCATWETHGARVVDSSNENIMERFYERGTTLRARPSVARGEEGRIERGGNKVHSRIGVTRASHDEKAN